MVKTGRLNSRKIFPKVSVMTEKTSAKTQEPRVKTSKTPVETPKTPDKILVELSANPDQTIRELANSIGRSVRATERAIHKLTDSGSIRHVGPKKNGYWEIIDEKEDG
jgi:ATP-dependent DNA helicase RecG